MHSQNSAFRVHAIVPGEDIEDIAKHLSRLASQLRGQPATIEPEWIAELIAFPKTWLLIAQLTDGTVAGMLTLSAFPRVSGWTPWIEGVVVDEALRGQGIGRALMTEAIAIARRQGFSIVNLSSRPGREAANLLYESVGFQVVPTNYRRLRL